MDDQALIYEVLFILGSTRLIEQRLIDGDSADEDLFGYCDHETGTIYIDPSMHARKDQLVSTLVHEGLHMAYPRWSEKRVRETEERLMETMTDEQVVAIGTIYHRLVKRKDGVKELYD